MFTLSEVEQLFKEHLATYLQNASFTKELWDALHTGYLSADYVDAMLFFNWSSSTRPGQIMEDGSRPTFHNMNIELGDFKAELEGLRNAGIPAEILMRWILDVTNGMGWNITPTKINDAQASPTMFPSSKRVD